MKMNAISVQTGELTHQNLDVYNVMLGAYEGDDRIIITLVGGETLLLQPKGDFILYNAEGSYAPPVSPEPAPDGLAQQVADLQSAFDVIAQEVLGDD